MNLSKLTSSDLISYSTVLENIITTNLEVRREISDAINAGFCKEKEIEKILNKSKDASSEADTIYAEIQKEMDMRVKKDLGMKFGVRRTQSIIKELDAFAAGKNDDARKKIEKEEAEALKISEETTANMSIAKDDTIE